MKASELISHLNRLISEHGDLPVNVTVSDGEGGHTDESCAGIVLCLDENEKMKSFLVADKETVLAFVD